jgi:hypothetical protein
MEKMKTGVTGIAIIMIIMMTIAFSGVASANWLTEYTAEKQTVNTLIGYDRTEIGDQGFGFWKSSGSKNLLDLPTLAFGTVVTDFNKNFNAIKSTGDTSKELGLFPTANSKKMKAYSKLLATDVQATTRAEVGMTDNPVLNYKIDAEGLNEGTMATGGISAGMSVYVADGSDGGLGSILSYEEIDAEGSNEGSMATGGISAGMSVYVADGSDGGLGSILSYEERSSASGSFQFHKEMSYTSKITRP